NIFPAFPERRDFDVYASMDPAKEVGGDFYDFFLVDEDRLALVIADVSDKGVPAALFMMVCKILIQNQVMNGLSPAKVLEKVNEQICANNREDMFVTVWLGILDLKTGKLTASNAGHEYPALKKAGGHFELIKDKHGLVVGGLPGLKYTEYEWLLEPGSKIFVYTDGVPEAGISRSDPFGTERMLAALREAEECTPQEVLRSVDRAVADFVKDAPQFDDLTMLCVEYYGQASS
ncbi:MAG: serine/threonine-protein phosphatase, partial [Clostridia bacterium]|nr:serine/threonine-protein phosphatase [Clostridia bacterium]